MNYDAENARIIAQSNAEGLTKITPEMIESGSAYIEVYAMKVITDPEDPDCTTSRLVEHDETADFWDVCVRPEDFADYDGCPYAEFEDMTEEECNLKVADLEAMFPGIAVSVVGP